MVRRVAVVLLALLSVAFVLSATGCMLVQREHYVVASVDAYAQAKNYSYRYYPSSQVYFDLERQWYFYLEDGNWKTAYALPEGFEVFEDEAVVLEMANERPYSAFETHRSVYPPGRV